MIRGTGRYRDAGPPCEGLGRYGNRMRQQSKKWSRTGGRIVLACVLSLVSFSGAAASGAAELGVVKVRSYFAQPLKVEIALRLPPDTELSSVKVSLASEKRFEAFGVDWEAIAQPLRISLQPGNVGSHPMVLISSRLPVRELALALVLEIDTVRDVSYHVVDVLLDAPSAQLSTSSPAVSPVANAPEVRAAATSPRKQATGPSLQGASGAAQQPPTPSPPVTAEYGPTQRFDTLYAIAAKVRPDTTVSVRDMAMQLFRANPKAFYRNNINNLRLGVVLKVPARGGGSPAANNVAEFERQMGAWKAEKGGSQRAVASKPPVASSIRGSVSSDAETSAVGATPSASSSASGRENLRNTSSQMNRPLLTLSAPSNTSALGDQVAFERAIRDRLGETNRSLTDRMAKLDTRIASLRALLNRHGDTMAALGAQAARIDKLTRAQPAAATTRSTTMRSTTTAPPNEVAPTATVPVSQEAFGLQLPVRPPATTPQAEMSSVAPASKSEQSIQPARVAESLLAFLETFLRRLTEQLSSQAMLVVLATLVVVLVAWIVTRGLARRAKQAVAHRNYERAEAGLRSHVSRKAAEAIDVTEPGIISAPPQLEATTYGVSPQSADPELAVAATTDSMQALFREVDVFVAYGRFDDARSRLNVAMEEHPDADELPAKLGEILFEAGDADAFVELAQRLGLRLREHGNHALWARIALLGRRLVPDEALFQASFPRSEEDVAGYEGVDELAPRRRRS